MRRRGFIINGAISTAALSASGCSLVMSGKKIMLERRFESSDYSFDVTRPRPKGGTIPVRDLGNTGIKVSAFGYGAHMQKDLVPFEEERSRMIRESYHLGVNTFDIYDHWGVEQFEPMSRHLAPMMNDVVLSLNLQLREGRTAEQEFERTLRLFKRDHIDMYRLNANAGDPASERYKYWDTLFRYKEQGKIRAVGMSIHFPFEVEQVLSQYPLDYVIIPYNFYHNLLWDGRTGGDFDPLAKRLRDKGIAIVVMKPFATDWFVAPMIDAAKQLDDTGEISLPQAMLRWVINSPVDPDMTIGGIFTLDHLYEDIPAYYYPAISVEELNLLKKLRHVARIKAAALLPESYRFLESWAIDSQQNTINNV
ncbi:aldo/keto reductase [Candidatus Latescibacterota bacterium]